MDGGADWGQKPLKQSGRAVAGSGTRFVMLPGMATKCCEVMVLLGVFSAGCAMQQASPPQSTAERPVYTDGYDDARCAALVFDPPVMADRPRMEFSRDQRQPSAYGGFDDPITTYYDIQTDDCQSNDPTQSYYQRRALMEKIGTNTR